MIFTSIHAMKESRLIQMKKKFLHPISYIIKHVFQKGKPIQNQFNISIILDPIILELCKPEEFIDQLGNNIRSFSQVNKNIHQYITNTSMIQYLISTIAVQYHRSI